MFDNLEYTYKDKDCILINDDCIKSMKLIPDKSINLILCDLPFGIIGCKWDKVLNYENLWKEYERIIKDNGVIVLFSSGNFTFDLICSNRKLLKYKYVWIKNTKTNFVHAKNRPLCQHEDILVFSKSFVGHKSQIKEKRMVYNPQGLILSNKKVKAAKSKFGEYMPKRPSHKEEYVQEYTNYPSDLLYYDVPSKKIHTSEKPINLLEFLIKTYSFEGDIVLDNCMGSASCGIACLKNNRFFIGMELNKEEYLKAENRIKEFKEKSLK